MAYVSYAVLAVPKENKRDYTKYARKAAKVFRKHGALRVIESWGDEIAEGKTTSFGKAVKRKADEEIVVSCIFWASKRDSDKGMKQAMVDPVFGGFSPPFDGKRLIFGNFKTIVDE